MKLTSTQRITIHYDGGSFTAQLLDKNECLHFYSADTPEEALAGLTRCVERAAKEFWFIRYKQSFSVLCTDKGVYTDDRDAAKRNCAVSAYKLFPPNTLITAYYNSEPKQ